MDNYERLKLVIQLAEIGINTNEISEEILDIISKLVSATQPGTLSQTIADCIMSARSGP